MAVGWSNGLPTDRFYNSYDQEKDKRFKYTYWSSTAEIPDEFDAIVPKDENGNPQHIAFYRPHIKKFREKMPNDNSQGSGIRPFYYSLCGRLVDVCRSIE